MYQHETEYRTNKINNSIDYHNTLADRNQQPKSRDFCANSDRLLVRDHQQKQQQQQPRHLQPGRIGCVKGEEGTELPIVYADANYNLFNRKDSQLDDDEENDDVGEEEDSVPNSSNRFESTGKQQSINRNHHNFFAYSQNNNNKNSSSVNYGPTGVNNNQNSEPSHSGGGRNFPLNYFNNTLDSSNYWLLNNYTRNLYQHHQATPKDQHLVMSHHRDNRRNSSNTLLRPYGNLSPNDMLLRSPYDSETSYNAGSTFNDRTRRLNNNSNTSTNRNLLSTNLNDSYYAECKYITDYAAKQRNKAVGR